MSFVIRHSSLELFTDHRTVANDYDRLLLLDDLKCSPEKQDLFDFCEGNNLKRFLDLPTCFEPR